MLQIILEGSGRYRKVFRVEQRCGGQALPNIIRLLPSGFLTRWWLIDWREVLPSSSIRTTTPLPLTWTASSFFGTARPSHPDLHRAQSWAQQGEPPQVAVPGNCSEKLPQAQLLCTSHYHSGCLNLCKRKSSNHPLPGMQPHTHSCPSSEVTQTHSPRPTQ